MSSILARRALLPALFAAACGADPELTRDEKAAALLARGPSAVGYASATVQTTSPVTGEARELPVELWYPATDAGEPVATYRLQGVVEVPAEGVLDAPEVAAGPHPVALYSHGSGGVGLVGYNQAEHLASHGWIVVAPDHVGNTTLDGLLGSDTPFLVTALHRPLDVTAVLDAVADGLGPLGDAADLERVFMFGHSFGAYTTLSVAGATLDVAAYAGDCDAEAPPDGCEALTRTAATAAWQDGFLDPRVAAIAPQAPALIGAFVQAELAALSDSVPVMIQSAGKDITTPDATNAEPLWATLSHPDDVWVEVPEGGHLSFLTTCEDIGLDAVTAFQPTAIDDGCGPDAPPASEILPVFAAYLLGFARAHVLGEEGWREVWAEGPPLDARLEVRGR